MNGFLFSCVDYCVGCCWVQVLMCCRDGRLFIADVTLDADRSLLCELVTPTVDVPAVAQPLQPTSFTAAHRGRTVYAVGQ